MKKGLVVSAPTRKSTTGESVNYPALAEQLKDQIALPDLLGRLGHPELAGARSGTTIRSPLRSDDSNPSFSVSTKDGVWVWAEMGSGGSIIDLVQQHEGLDLKGAVKFLAESYGMWPDSADGGSTSIAAPAKQYTPQNWPECVERFTETRVQELAQDRGYSLKFCEWLKKRKLVGLHDGAYAFPVRLPDKPGSTIAFHVKGPHGWAYKPDTFEEDGITKISYPATPFIVGDPKTAAEVHVFEGQWDMFATMDALGWIQGKLGAPEQTAWVNTRGGGNGKLVGDAHINDRAKVYVWSQKDLPDAAGRVQSGIWGNAVRAALPDHTLLRVPLPMEAPADQNDWLRMAGDGAPEEFRVGYLRARAWDGDGLPDIQEADRCIDLPWERPAEVIHGYLYERSKLVIQAGSKIGKTWAMVDLGLSVATGTPWWDIPTTAGYVLYLNFELEAYFFVEDRMKWIARAKSLAPGSYGKFHFWNLRGYADGFDKLLPLIAQRIKMLKYSLVIIDPLYMGLGDLDENSAGDMTKLFNEIEKLCQASGASVVVTHHFAKGSAAGKESIDRGSGSGVIGRNPDGIISITPQGEEGTEDHFTVEASLRNHRRPPSFVIQWVAPLFLRDLSSDPSMLKRPNPGGRGAPARHNIDQIVEVLRDQDRAVPTREWCAACVREYDMSKATFERLKKKASELGLITSFSGQWWVKKQEMTSQMNLGDDSDVPF